MTIQPAKLSDVPDILEIIKKSFSLYRDELPSSAGVAALSESETDVLNDIKSNRVFTAKNDKGQITGTIRYKKIGQSLAYIYRFGVDPQINNTGIGSALLNAVIEQCKKEGFFAIALHTNSKYYRLARYYYGKGFYVHSTDQSRGYIRALFVLELSDKPFDLSPAFRY